MSISHQSRMLTLPSARLHVQSWGAGAPVLCLHATGHAGEDFAEFAERVGDRFAVHALDWPGQGLSPHDGALPRAAHYANLALQACDALQLGHPILLGNSIGGAAAIIAAHSAPQKFRGLVLCNAGGLAPVDMTARTAIGAMAAFFDAGARGAPWFPSAFAAYYAGLVLPRAPQRRNEIIAQGRAIAPLLAEAWRGFAEPDADLRNIASNLELPVWCAWARGDQLVSWARSRAAINRIPNVRTRLFRGGHAAFLEDADRFAADFIDFAGALS